jgi:hypothetical protein
VLLVIIGLLWVALLAPMAIRRLRDSGTEKSIESFHVEHEVLKRQGYTVPPAHRLDEREPEYVPSADRRARLTVVHADDTYQSLESRSSWDEWSEDYDYDDEPRTSRARLQTGNRYAAAYASVPSDVEVYDAPLTRRRSARAQRRMIFTRLVLATVVTTALAVVVGYSFLVDLAIVTWVALAGFVALALFAVSQGYLDQSSLGLGRTRVAPLATIEPLRVPRRGYEADQEFDYADAVAGYEADEEPVVWQRASRDRYALG